MSLIQISNLTFAYDGSSDDIFHNVSFQLDTDWRLGFIGRNGRGKTTFLQLLLGKYPYQGKITAPTDFAYFPYPVDEPQQATLAVLEAIHPELLFWKLQRELSALEVDEEVLYRPFSTLSNGEQTKVLLAVLFIKENRFLLIDEPTNHLDMAGRALVSRYLSGKKGFILVSHDRTFLDGCTDHILSINKTNIEIHRGNFSSWWENKARRDAWEQAENEKLKQEIIRLQETVREKAQWSNTAERRKVGIDPMKVDNKKGYRPLQAAKSAKLMRRAKAIEERQQAAVTEKSKLLKNIESADTLKIYQASYHTSRLAVLRELSIAYGRRRVCENVSFTIEAGDRIALQGANGSGKSSLIKLLCGEAVPHTGEVKIGNSLTISYVPQDTAFLSGSVEAFSRDSGIDRSLFLAMLRKLDISPSQFSMDMRDFSAGQKKKVLLAKSLCQKAHLHIWDEPMNYIDVSSRIQLEDLLLQYQPTILFVEHDQAFCRRVATKTICLSSPDPANAQ